LLSNDETDVLDKMRVAGNVSLYCPEAVVEHVIDPSRLTHDWFRRRAAWQAVSDFIKDPERKTAYAPAAAEHMRLLHKNGSPDVPMGFFGRVEDPAEFQRDVGLIYDVVVAMLAGGAQIDPATDQGAVAALKAKAAGRLRKIMLTNPRVRQILRLALRGRGLLRRA
jgi:glucosyl-dolichyl phosphate glucuronosyltransferase